MAEGGDKALDHPRKWLAANARDQSLRDGPKSRFYR